MFFLEYSMNYMKHNIRDPFIRMFLVDMLEIILYDDRELFYKVRSKIALY